MLRRARHVALQPGERFTLDAGHMVAYDEGMQMQPAHGRAGQDAASLKSGEGWVFDFTGPGRVMSQSRNP